MKKILTVLLLLGGLSAAAEDSYLYWMVGDTGSYSYDTVRVKAYDASGNAVKPYLNIYAPDAESSTGLTSDSYSSVTREQAGMGALYAYLGSDPTYSSFVIELWNDSTFVAQSEALSMSAASASYIVTNNSTSMPMAPWSASSFAIPEPNSAMLVLLGCAALGLRRRRLIRS